jgi:hypothetical protein
MTQQKRPIVDELALAGRVKVNNPSDDARRIWPGDPAEPSLDVVEPGDGLPGCPQASAQKAKPGTLVKCSNAPHAIPPLVEDRLARIATGVESGSGSRGQSADQASGEASTAGEHPTAVDRARRLPLSQ